MGLERHKSYWQELDYRLDPIFQSPIRWPDLVYLADLPPHIKDAIVAPPDAPEIYFKQLNQRA